ncbi:MAG: hydantoinase/oxoprolinase family protein [Thermodesulfobacteria bacterium]|nr:hydantoinase/oxoprolinase family protein [Thermodesulfobacteriota bacterium]
MRVAVDTGGTFTDFVAESEGRLLTHKVPSTPEDPSRAVLKGLAELGGHPAVLLHGTTVGTNAFLTRRGAKVLLITTAGFEDVIFIGRQNRPKLFDFWVQKPRPLLSRRQVVGVPERVNARGEVLKALSSGELEVLRRFVTEKGFESVAVSLLHSYANPIHERKIKEALSGTGVPLSLSSEILPEFREFERTSTTLVNAYLAPIMARYVGQLARNLPQTKIFLMQSSGGLMPAEAAGRRAAATLLSGPAGGVHGAFTLARLLGLEKIITFDMGGTSTDVSLCDGEPTYTRQYVLEGYPVHLKMIDIHTIGAGGGSIASFDKGGALRVGPESAGADPGPACYGKGGRMPTVTDANLLLGRLLPHRFLAGRLSLQPEASRRVFQRLAESRGFRVEELALGVIEIVNNHMEQAIKKVSVERGIDPQDFTLVCFGGAGGLHATALAERLSMKRILVPRLSGVLSALGLLMARPSFDFSQAVFLSGPKVAYEYLLPLFDELIERALKELSRYGYRREELEVKPEVDLRYQGQSYELTVGFEPGFIEKFHALHQRLYGYAMPLAPLEAVAIRVSLSARVPDLELPEIAGKELSPAEETEVILRSGERVSCQVYLWEDLPGETSFSGPALVVGPYATVWVEPGWQVDVDRYGNLWLAPAR